MLLTLYIIAATVSSVRFQEKKKIKNQNVIKKFQTEKFLKLFQLQFYYNIMLQGSDEEKYARILVNMLIYQMVHTQADESFIREK